MNTFKGNKKTAKDWHRADIVAALHKAGYSLRRLSLENGYSSATTLSNALDKPYLKAERIIADAIGVSPKVIWPQRYEYRAKNFSNKMKGRI